MSTVNLNNLVATWNDPAVNFRAIRLNAVNTASGAGSLLMEMLVGGATRMTLSPAGTLFVSNQVQSPGFAVSGGGGVNIGATGLGIASDQTLRFSSTTSAGGVADVILRREAANELGMRNGVNPQSVRIYNTFTDASNNERGTVGWNSNSLELASDAIGTGVARGVRLRAGSGTANLSPDGQFTASNNISSHTGRFRNFNSGTNILLTNTDGVIGLYNNGQTDFDRLQFGGTTAAFPAIRRQGAGLDFMVADASNFCDIRIRNRISFGANSDSPRIKRTGAFLDIIPVTNEALFAKLRVGTLGFEADCDITRDGADQIAMQRGINPQNFHVYNTFTDSGNYERGTVGWVANIFEVASTRMGTGVQRPVRFRVGDTVAVLSTSGWSVQGEVSSSTGQFRNPGFTRIHCSNTDGVVTLFNNAQTDFNRLQFGGTTSSFPALKRNGTRLDVRLADDSVFSQIAVSQVQLANGNVAIGNTSNIVAILTGDGASHAPLRASQFGLSTDLVLERDAADRLALRRGTNPQAFRVYNTFTDTANNERGIFSWVSNALRIGTERAGTGAARDLELVTNNQTRLSFTGSTGFLSYNGEGASINCTSEFSTVASQNVFISQTNTVFSHLTSSAALRIEHGNKKFFPTWIDWSLGGMSHNRWNSGYIDNLFLHNNVTDINNWERGSITWASNTLRIGTEHAGSGVARALSLVTGGVERIQINAEGLVGMGRAPAASTRLALNGLLSADGGTFSYSSSIGACLTATSGARCLTVGYLNGSNVQLGSATSLGWTAGTDSYATLDTVLVRDAADTLAQRRGTSAQAMRIYNTFTDSSNWERGFVRWSSGEFQIGTEASGTGTQRDMRLSAGHSLALQSNGVLTLSSDLIYLYGLSEVGIEAVDGFFAGSYFGFQCDVIGMANPNSAIVANTNCSIGTAANRFTNANIDNLYLHNTYTNSTNWERGFVRWVANAFEIATERNGSGVARPIIFRTNTVNRLTIGSAGTITAALAASQNFIITGLPTTNPNVAGALWNDGGTLRVSAG